MDAYSQLKPLMHPSRIAFLKAGMKPKPVHVQLILSDLCNQDCHFCAYRMSGGLSTELFRTAKTHNPNRKIPTDKAIEIIMDCEQMGVQAIQFTGGGEPTVHPDYLELIELAQNCGMKTGLVTNGVKLDPTHIAIQSLDWLRISVDAGTPESYCEVRNVKKTHWTRVWKNIELLSDYGGRLGVGFVVTNENWDELHLLAMLCEQHGVDNLRVGAVFSEAGLDYYHDFAKIAAAIKLVKEEYDSKDFEVVDLFGRRMSDLEGGPPEFEFCGYQYFTTYIGADLNVYRCCNTAYTKQGMVGNLKEQSFADAQLIHAPFDARGCRHCQFKGQNAAINAMLHPPEHSEFV